MLEGLAMARKVAVITGATRGLGWAMAHGFARAGCEVAGCGRSREQIDELARELPGPHMFRALDVTTAEVEEWAREVVDELGPPDLVLNNAALMNAQAPLWEVPQAEFSDLIDVNLKGVFAVCRAFLPVMVERRQGVIVNFSSGWGRSTSPGVAPYCATKYGVEGLTKALAQELPPGMAAVPLSPGIIDTDMLRVAWGDGAAAYPGPEEWAKRAVPYLLSLDASANGQSLTVP
ncbi:MAG: SDR family oxidoreductase [bacterium]|nr:SDR family oxidoreductase [bacterium]